MAHDRIDEDRRPEPRMPVLFLIDTSMSMAGCPIGELHEGLKAFKKALMRNPVARRRIEVSIVTFGEKAELAQDFISVEQFEPPHLGTSGGTAMGAGLDLGLDQLSTCRARYREVGIPCYKPFVFLMTDGAPTDSWQRAAGRIHVHAPEFRFVAIGVGPDADMETLGKISPVRYPVRLDRLDFLELFTWIVGEKD